MSTSLRFLLHRLTLLRVTLLTLPFVSAFAQPVFRGLGPDTTRAFDVSTGGVVVGYGRVGLTAARQAFAWSATNGLSPLGGNVPWYQSTVATSLSRDGAVIVGQDGDHAFRWTSADGRVSLGIPAGSAQSAATGVSRDGAVVVGSGYSADSGRGAAFRWTADGLQPLGVLPGTQSSFATGVSGDGAVVVGYGGSFDLEAFRWTERDGMVGLGSIRGAPITYSYAQGISEDGGTIIGLSASPHGYEAFRWTEAGGMVGLDPDGAAPTAATACSADGGLIIGNWLGPIEAEDAFVWSARSGIRSLVDVMTRDYHLGRQLAGWTNLGAYAMSDDGRYIAGTGYFDSVPQAWLLDRGAHPPPLDGGGLVPVPEPSTYGWLAAGLGAAVVLLRLRRVRHASGARTGVSPGR
jgi:uncharacterized membrane protein